MANIAEYPWTVEKCEVLGSDGQLISTYWEAGPACVYSEEYANLIGAAPDMYEALKRMLAAYDNGGIVTVGRPIATARAAIAKAEGKEALQ